MDSGIFWVVLKESVFLVDNNQSICLWEVRSPIWFFQNMNSVHCINACMIYQITFFIIFQLEEKCNSHFLWFGKSIITVDTFFTAKMFHFRNTSLIYRKWFFFIWTKCKYIFQTIPEYFTFQKKLNQLDRIAKLVPSSAEK